LDLNENNKDELNKGTIQNVIAFAKLIIRFGELAQNNDAYDAATAIAKESGILKDLYNDKSPEGVSRYENIQELLNGIKEFSINAKEESLPEKLENYIEDVALLTDLDNEKEENHDKVTLMTIHSAKGLEFKNVFVVGLEKDLFPLNQSDKNPESIEEERRLFYVALTRACENAWLTFAKQRYRWGELAYCEYSCFIDELDKKYLDNDNFKTIQYPNNKNGFQYEQRYKREPFSSFQTKGSQNISTEKLVNLNKTVKQNQEFEGNNPTKILPGMYVEHQRFGIGKVLKLEGNIPDLKATVFFQNAGTKQLLLKFAKLKIAK
jgi:DNA helicase-2/ATP-dependent DNA helicase PcrA